MLSTNIRKNEPIIYKSKNKCPKIQVRKINRLGYKLKTTIYYLKTSANPIAPTLANDSEYLIRSLSHQPPLSLPSAGAGPIT